MMCSFKKLVLQGIGSIFLFVSKYLSLNVSLCTKLSQLTHDIRTMSDGRWHDVETLK